MKPVNIEHIQSSGTKWCFKIWREKRSGGGGGGGGWLSAWTIIFDCRSRNNLLVFIISHTNTTKDTDFNICYQKNNKGLMSSKTWKKKKVAKNVRVQKMQRRLKWDFFLGGGGDKCICLKE